VDTNALFTEIIMENENIFVALNIGSAQISAMAVRKNAEGQLRILGVEQGKSDGVRYGEIINSNDTGAVVNRLLKLLHNRTGYEIGAVYVGLNGRSLKTLRASNGRQLNDGAQVTDQLLSEMYDEVKSAETEQGVIYGVYQQETRLDDEPEFFPVGCDCKKVETNYRVVLGKPELRTKLESCIEKAGCKLIDAPIQIVTMAETLLSSTEREQGCCLIDFGAQSTSLVIFYQGYLRYLAVIPMGGKNITKDIASFDIPEKTAEQIKVQFADAVANRVHSSQRITLKSNEGAIEPKQISLQTLAYITEARGTEILNLILMHIQKSGLEGRLDAGIIITGNASKLKNLDVLIQQKIQMPVRTGNHSRYLEDGTAEHYYDVNYSPLIGILLSAEIDCRKSNLEKPVAKMESQKPPKKNINIFNKLKDRLTDGFGVLFQDDE
jgi:cell division protein FtsA